MDTPEIGDNSHKQPRNYRFPSHEFGKNVVVRRSFQDSWFTHFPWLCYDAHRDTVFCFIRVIAHLKKRWSQLAILNLCIFLLVTQIGKRRVLNF